MKLYLCNPKKNTECLKTHCQIACKCTTKKEYRATMLERVIFRVLRVIRRVNTK